MSRQEPTIVAVYEREFVRFDGSITAMILARLVSEDELDKRIKDAHVKSLEPEDQLEWAGQSGDEVRIKVDCEPNELIADQEYLWRGTWHEHPAYGMQFHASSFVLRQPHGRTGIIAYLAHAGEGHGMGKGKAEGLWDLYGSDAVAMMRTQPLECVVALHRKRLYLHEKEALEIAKILADDQQAEAITLDLLDVLEGRGFPKETARACINEWGMKASQTVRRDPYKLMLFPRCGFRRCDATFLELGHNPLRLKRQALAAWYAIRTKGEGNTWLPMTMATAGVRQYVGGTKVDPERAVAMALGRGKRGRILKATKTRGVNGVLDDNGSFAWVAEAGKANDEADLASMVARSFAESARWPDQLFGE